MNNNKLKKQESRKKIFCIAAIAIVFVLIASTAGYSLIKSKVSPNEILSKEELEVRKNQAAIQALKNSITESGTVELGISTQIYDLDISAESSEDEDDEEESGNYLQIAEVYAAVGQRLQKGDKIYRLTEESIEAVRKTLTYAQTEAQIALAQAQTDYNVGVLEAGLSHNETMLESVLAQTAYDNTIARLNNDIAAKNLEIEQLLADIYKLQLALTDEDYLEQKSEITEAYDNAIQQVEDAAEDFVTNQVSAAETFWTAKESYETFFNAFDTSNQQIDDKVDEVYAIQKEIEYSQQLLEKELLAAGQTLNSSQMQGEIADTKFESSLAGYENTLTKSQAALEEAVQKLEDFNEFVGDGTIYAAESGLVTEVGYAQGDYLINAGVLAAYAAAEDMTIKVDVLQEDIVKMAVGDSVDITFTAYKGEAYTGIIQSITTTATSRSSATISYPVVISIQGDTSKLYGGMTADITFTIGETEENADSVQTNGGQK